MLVISRLKVIDVVRVNGHGGGYVVTTLPSASQGDAANCNARGYNGDVHAQRFFIQSARS